MSIVFTGLQRIEYFKRFYPIDHIAGDEIKTGDAVASGEILVIVNRNGKNWLDPLNQNIDRLKQILKTSILTEFICDMQETSAKTRHRQLSLLLHF